MEQECPEAWYGQHCWHWYNGEHCHGCGAPPAAPEETSEQ